MIARASNAGREANYVCRSKSKGGKRCTFSHPAMRAAQRAASKQLGETVAAAGEGHPAQDAFTNAQQWTARTKEAIEAGDDAKAAMFAENAKRCSRATRSLLRGRRPKDAYPDAADSALVHAPVPPPPPERDRAARALAGAAGIGGRARVMPTRQDGGRTTAWNDKDFGGAATVYPGVEDEPPHARVVFHRLDSDRYQGRCQVERVLGGVSRFGTFLAAVVTAAHAVAGRPATPVIWSQIAKRMIISAR
ncbi:hypothetical protein ACWD4L_35275 [Streptomyces sp. NPDC002596]